MANNLMHHGRRAGAHAQNSVLDFKRRSNSQKRNKWNFVVPSFLRPSHVIRTKKHFQGPKVLTRRRLKLETVQPYYC